jgi:hypothetical protein
MRYSAIDSCKIGINKGNFTAKSKDASHQKRWKALEMGSSAIYRLLKRLSIFLNR